MEREYAEYLQASLTNAIDATNPLWVQACDKLREAEDARDLFRDYLRTKDTLTQDDLDTLQDYQRVVSQRAATMHYREGELHGLNYADINIKRYAR